MKTFMQEEVNQAFNKLDERVMCDFNMNVALEDAVRELRLHFDYLEKVEGLTVNFPAKSLREKDGKRNYNVGNYFIIFRDINWNKYTHNLFNAYESVRKQLTEYKKENKKEADMLIKVLDNS